MTPTDTIVAVSSPPGVSARALIRVSGSEAARIAAGLIEPLPDRPRTMTRVRLRSPPIPCWCVHYAGPRSFTGEDLIELQLPGNPVLLERVVRSAVQAGARPAEPGEFTFRAFAAGRLDLTQAEGVAATIAATSDSQLAAATLLREGELGRLAGAAVDRLAALLARVEAGIDFTDQEDVVAIAPATLDAELRAVERELADVLARARPWRTIESLPWVVLVGRPSIGKSTLFNALLGRARAVVSATAGTTRDLLVEPWALDDGEGRRIEVMLVDLAGLDAPRAALDRTVQAAARDAIARADLVLQINDLAVRHDAPALRVRTRIDIDPPDDASAYDVCVSARTGEGLEALRRAIYAAVASRGVSMAGDLLALQPRHDQALRAAAAALAEARRQFDAAAPALARPERVAAALRVGLDHLGELGGAMTPDDVLGRVFATFCIGK